MAEETKSLEGVISTLLETNARLDRISVNTELAAEAAIEALPSADFTKNTESFNDTIRKDLKDIADCVCLKMVNSLEAIADRSKFIMDDIATITMFMTELASVKPSEERKGGKGLKSGDKPRFIVTSLVEAEKLVVKKGSIGGSKKSKKADSVTQEKEIEDPFEGLGLSGQIVSLMIDLGKEAFGMMKGFAELTKKGIQKFLNSDFMKVMKESFAGITGFLAESFKEAKDVLKGIVNSEFGQKFLKPIGDLLSNIGKQLFKGISWISDKVGGMFKRLAPGLSKVLGAFLSKMPGVKKVVDIGVASFKKITGMTDDDVEKQESGKTKKANNEKDKKITKKEPGPLAKTFKVIGDVAKAFAKFTKGLGDVVKYIMISLADGIKAFGDTKVLKGAVSLIAMGGALLLTVTALKQFADVDWQSILKAGVVLLGLGLTAEALGKMKGDILMGSLALVALGASLWVAGKAFQQFASLDWSTIGKAFVALLGVATLAAAAGALSELILPGALAIAALGAALWVSGKGFQTFADLDWETIGKGLTAALGIGVLGAVLGVASPLILAGSLALGAMGVALGVLGLAMKTIAPEMDTLVNSLERLADIGGTALLGLAAGITALGISLAAFAAGSVLAGLGNLVTKFLSFGADTPIEQLIKLGQQGEGVTKAAEGLSRISDAMKKMSDIPKDAMSAVNDFPWVRATAFVAAGGAMETKELKISAVTAPTVGAEMNLYQKNTNDLNNNAAAAAPMILSGGGSNRTITPVNNSSVNSVTYNNTALPDRTYQTMMPQLGY